MGCDKWRIITTQMPFVGRLSSDRPFARQFISETGSDSIQVPPKPTRGKRL